MNKILVVPDVHGRTFWRKAIEMIDEVDKVVFLGDYLDPYPSEGINFEEAISEFVSILQFKETYSDKVILLIGNHDCNYIWQEFPKSSRYSWFKAEEISKLFNKNIDKFQLIYQYDNYLFSHAGVYKDWMDLCNFTLDDLTNIEEIRTNNWPSLYCVGAIRGGWRGVGSCVWADIRESGLYDLYSDKYQIVGHTQLKEPFISDNIACLDCRKCFIVCGDEIKAVSEEANSEVKS